MANTAKRTTTTTSAKRTTTKTVEPKVENVVEKEETVEVKKTFEPEDLIPCRSLVSGELFVVGNRSNYLYQWADYGDIIEVEYRDLIYMIRSNDKTIYEPRIVIEDDDIVSEYARIGKLYDSLYSVQDLRDILFMNANDMKANIEPMPNGAKEAIKGLAATMIDEGTLDSVSNIRVLDEIFGTKLLLTLVQD